MTSKALVEAALLVQISSFLAVPVVDIPCAI